MDSRADPAVKSKSKHSAWSLKSKREPLKFKKLSRPKSRPHSELSCLSRETDRSKEPILFFSEETDPEPYPESPEVPPTRLDQIFMHLEVEVHTFVRDQLKRFYRVLASDYPEECLLSEDREQSSEAVLNITLDFLRRMKHERLAELLYSKTAVAVCSSKLKGRLHHRFSAVFEGVAKAGNAIPLNQIFTELSLNEGRATEIKHEHEVRQIESFSKKPISPETTIRCADIFKGRPDSQEQIRTVMTTGVAGIGKTVLTQKFSLDWAQGTANQDIQLLFPFTFRELNVLRHTRFSLVGLLHHFFSEAKELCSFEDVQVLFIFDGLDESRLSLDFRQTPLLTESTECVSLEVLLVNLIRGTLLPSANLWITTRPAAANQIPAECISLLTEVPGFADHQKVQYFRKRFKDEQQATIIIAHIKASQSLFIMCYIPVFCWILVTVLLHVMETGGTHQLPHTLTQMYIQFLVVQAKVKNLKYDGCSETDFPWTPETRKMVASLGKLAFEQLQKGKLIFYESDLTECGLDATAAAKYSGVFTQVFREESGLYHDKIYCFVHLSVQEFLAAHHVHQTFFNTGVNLLSTQPTSESHESKAAFYRSAVDQALQSPNGHLDLLLRFLLGLSLPTNQDYLRGLLTPTGRSTDANEETVEYLKERLNGGLSSERSMNLFHCLNELNDRSLVEVIQEYMRQGFLPLLSCPGHWSAVAFILLSSDSDLKDFDLRKYQASQTALQGLLPVIKASTKATLCGCNLSQSSCVPLASVIVSSNLKYLDLSNNDLQDSGLELLCSGLTRTPCKLETLKLSGCLVSERGGASLASALKTALSNLKELDLSYNHLGSSTEILSALRDDPHTALDVLKFDPSGERWMIPGPRKYCCVFSLDPNTAHRRLHLSEDKQTVTNVGEDQQYPDHEDRFNDCPSVLSATGLRGRCYYEVQWEAESRERLGVDIALSYGGIQRRGGSGFGDDDQSWSLRICDGSYHVCHNGSVYFSSDEVGVSADNVAVSSDNVGVSSDRGGVPSDEVGGSSNQVGASSSGDNVRVEKPRVSLDDAGVSLQDMGVSSDKVGVSSDKAGVSSDKVGVSSEKVAVSSEKVGASSDKVSASSEKVGAFFDKVGASSDKVAVSSEKVGASSDKVGASSDKVGASSDKVVESSDQVAVSSDEAIASTNEASVSSGKASVFAGRVGVFLDSEAGSLSFYWVGPGGELSHLHTITSSFAAPLFPGFRLSRPGSTVSLVNPIPP